MASNGYKNKQQQLVSGGQRPPFFDGENYYKWKELMRLYLESVDMDLWYVIQDGPYVPMKTKFIDGVERRVEARRHELTEADKRKLSINSKAMLILLNALNRNEAAYVFRCNCAKGIWEKLEMKHEGAYKELKIRMLEDSFEDFKMSPDESITDMDGRLTEITNMLESLGERITNEEVLRKILQVLPSKWYLKVEVIRATKDLRKLTKEELMASLLVYEASLNAEKVAESETSRSSDSDERGQSKRISNRGKAQQRPKFQSNSKCYMCGDFGHMSYDCPYRKR